MEFYDAFSIMTAISKNPCMVFKQVFYSIKPLNSILESSKDDETRLILPQSYPITQQSLFGKDFDKSSEKFIKELPIANFC